MLETFAAHGAPEEILWEQKPHVGTDRLKGVVASLREEIRSLGGTVCFESRLDRLILRDGAVAGAQVTCHVETREIETDTVLLCIGHSARDTVRSLLASGVRMVQKPFAMGVRIEHPRELIDQLGRFAIDEITEEKTVSRFFHDREEAIRCLREAGPNAGMRETTLEDVFLERLGRRLEKK